MADHVKERLENPTLPFLQETVEAQLERAKVTLSPEWTRHPPSEAADEHNRAPERRARPMTHR
jgi:hypothetical protein